MDNSDKKRFPEGIITAVITPFSDGQPDISAFRSLILRQIDAGIGGIVVLGTTGEAPTVSKTERKRLIDTALECADGKAFIIAGCGTSDTKASLESAKDAQRQGVNGILAVTPYYNKPSQKGLIYHYLSVAEGIDVPVMMYNVPSRTGVGISTETSQVLFAHENITALKEACTDINEICDKLTQLSEYDIYCGNDSLLPAFLSLGARGCVSVVSNALPRAFGQIYKDYASGEYKRSEDSFKKMYPLLKALCLDTNPAGIKSLMANLGCCKDELRLPLTRTRSDIAYAIFDAYIQTDMKG